MDLKILNSDSLLEVSMKKWMILSFALASVVNGYSDEFESLDFENKNGSASHQECQFAKAKLTSKVIVNSATGYYTFSDGSLWKVINCFPRWRSLSEWWNDVRVVPDAYQSSPSDWYLGADITMIPRAQGNDRAEQNASNKTELDQATHLLLNEASGKKLFAISMRPEECLREVYNLTHKEAYSQGYLKGQLSRDLDASKQYEKGFDAGYYEGYKEALIK